MKKLFYFLILNVFFVFKLLGQIDCSNAIEILNDTLIRDTFEFQHYFNPPECSKIIKPAERGVWYKVRGKGNIMRIDNYFVQVFKGSCENLECSDDDFRNFYLEEGVIYFIYVFSHESQYQPLVLNLKLNFFALKNYASCNKAVQIDCNGELKVNSDHLIYKDGNCLGSGGNRIWIKIKGDGGLKKITWTGFRFGNIVFYEGDSCLNNCIFLPNGLDELSFQTESGLEYTLGIQPLNEYEKFIEIFMNCAKEEDSRSIINAKTIFCGESQKVEAKYDVYSIFASNDKKSVSNAFWYKFQPKVKSVVEINGNVTQIQNGIFKIYRKLNNSRSNNNLEEIGSKGYFDKVKFSIVADPNYEYFISISPFRLGNFDLTISCLPLDFVKSKPFNLNCGITQSIDHIFGNREEIILDNENVMIDQWYKLPTNISDITLEIYNQIPSGISFTLFQVEGNVFKPLKSTPNLRRENTIFNFKLDPKNIYVVGIGTDFFNTGERHIRMTCNQGPEKNRNCESSLELRANFSTQIIVKSDYYYDNSISKNNFDGGLELRNQFWSKIKGNDKVLKLNSFGADCKIFEGSCGFLNELRKTDSIFGKENEYSFFAEKEKEYFIMANALINEVTLFFTESEKAVNSNCENALEIICGQKIEISEKGFYNDLKNNHNSLVSMWYKVKGKNQEFDINDISAGGYFSLYKNSCEQKNLLIKNGKKKAFYGEINNEYYIEIQPNPRVKEKIVFELQCRDNVPPGGSFITPYSIACNEKILIDFSLGEKSKTKIGYSEFWLSHQSEIGSIILQNELIYMQDSLTIDLFDVNNNLIASYRSEKFTSDPYLYGTSFQVLNGYYKLRLLAKENSKILFTLLCDKNFLLKGCSSAKILECDKTYIWERFESESQSEIKNQFWFRIPNEIKGYKITVEHPELILMEVRNNKGCSSIDNDGYALTGKPTRYFFHADTNQESYLVFYKASYDTTLTRSEIKVECVTANSAASCEKALELNFGISNKFNTFHNKVSTTGFCDKELIGSWFKFKGNGQKIYFLIKNINSEILRNPVYFFKGNCDSLICEKIDYIDHKKNFFTFDPIDGVEYFLKIPHVFITGEFEIDIISIPTINFDCLNPIKIECNKTYVDFIDPLKPKPSQLCNTMATSKYYNFEGNGESLMLTFKNLDEKSKILIELIEGSCEKLNCLFNKEITKYCNTFYIKTNKSSNYILKISASETIILFETSCLPIQKNVSNDMADTINCSQSILNTVFIPQTKDEIGCFNPLTLEEKWYILPSNLKIGKISTSETNQKFSLEIYDSNINNNFELINYFEEVKSNQIFQAGLNNTYIKIKPILPLIENFEFQIECLKPLENDLCSNPITLKCGDSINQNISLTERNKNNTICGSSSELDLFYTFTGDSSIWEFSLNEIGENTIILDIIANDSCNTTKCVQNKLVTTNLCNADACLQKMIFSKQSKTKYLFQSEKNKNYYLVASSTAPGSNFSISIDCLPKALNDICTNASNLEYNKPISLDLSNYFDDYERNCCRDVINNGAWFTFLGNDSILSVIEQSDNLLTYSIFEGKCEQPICIQTGDIYTNNPLLFKTQKDKKYFIVFGLKKESKNEKLSLHVSTFEALSNVNCSSGLKLKCDDVISFKDFNYPLSYEDCLFKESGSWFVFPSTHNTISLQLLSDNEPKFSLHNNCNDYGTGIINLSDFSPFKFYSPKNDPTKIFMRKNLSNIQEITSFKVGCYEGYENTSRNLAKTISCGSYSIKMYEASSSKFSSEDEIWYKFTGNGKPMKVGYDNDNVLVQLFEDFPTSIHNFEKSSEFLTESSKNYYLKVSFRQTNNINDLVNIFFEYNCLNSVESEDEIKFKNLIYPNPVKNQLKFDYKNEQLELFSHYEIIDMTGKVLFFGSLNEILLEGIDISDLESSVYFIRFKGYNKSKTQIFIKID